MKDLNRSQLIMLALLLSFVTSIATGITTVTLMQQAPPSVTVPINNVIRETVERIVPVPGKNTTQTVIIKEEDLVVDAIAKNQSAIFTITKEVVDLEDKTIEVSAGHGLVVSPEGFIVADSSLVPGGQVYFVKNSSGKFKAEFVNKDESKKNGFSFLKIGAPLDEKNKLVLTVPVFGDLSKMKAGQKVLLLGNAISSFIFDGNKNLELNVTKSNGGGVVIDLDGGVLGIALSGESSSFASASLILEIFNAKEIPPKEGEKIVETPPGGTETKTL